MDIMNPYSVIRLRKTWTRGQRRKAVMQDERAHPLAVTHHKSIFLFGDGYEVARKFCEGKEDTYYAHLISAESLHIALYHNETLAASLGIDRLGLHTCDEMPSSGINL